MLSFVWKIRASNVHRSLQHSRLPFRAMHEAAGETDGILTDRWKSAVAEERNFYKTKNEKLNSELMELEREWQELELSDDEELYDNNVEFIDFPLDTNFSELFEQIEPVESDLMALEEFDVDLELDENDAADALSMHGDVQRGDILVEDKHEEKYDTYDALLDARKIDTKIDLINCDITEPDFHVPSEHLQRFPSLDKEYLEIESNPPIYRSYRKTILGDIYKEVDEDLMDEVLDETWDDQTLTKYDSAFIESYHVFDVFDSISSEYSDLLRSTIDIFDNIVSEKQEKLLSKVRKKKRFDIWWAKTWQRREEGQKRAREARAKRRAANAQIEQTRRNDPNWVYYPACQTWVSAELLRNHVVRNAVGAICNNPSLNPKAKRYLIEGIQNDIRKIVIMEDVPETHKILANHLIESEVSTPPEDPKEIDGLLKLPYNNWEEMIAEIEATMDPVLKSQKFSFSSPTESSANSTGK